jgi:hypothetical protein
LYFPSFISFFMYFRILNECLEFLNKKMDYKNGKWSNSVGLRIRPNAWHYWLGPSTKSPGQPMPTVQYVCAHGAVTMPRAGVVAQWPAAHRVVFVTGNSMERGWHRATGGLAGLTEVCGTSEAAESGFDGGVP